MQLQRHPLIAYFFSYDTVTLQKETGNGNLLSVVNATAHPKKVWHITSLQIGDKSYLKAGKLTWADKTPPKIWDEELNFR